MSAIRKCLAVLLALGAVFFAMGLVLAPPAIGPAAVLAVLALAMAAAAALLWPRRPAWRLPDDLVAEEPARPAEPVQSRFGHGKAERVVADLNHLFFKH